MDRNASNGAPSGLCRRGLLAAAATALIARPAIVRAQDAPRRGGVLKVSAPRNPTSLDPITGVAGSDHSFLYCLYDQLVDWDPDTLAPKPGLAERWEYRDPQTLVLTLRQGVTFHDGTPFDAAAAKWNIDRTLTHPNSNVKGDIAAIGEVVASGPMEVTLRLKEPDAALLLALSDRAGFQVSPAAAQQQGGQVDRSPVGTGPYRFVSWADAERVVVQRNDRHWRPGEPLLDGIEFTIIQEVNTGLRSVMAGENDLVFDLAPQQRPVIRRAGNLVDVVGPSLTFDQLYLNYGRPPFSDLRVRRALDLAIDREGFTKATTFGLGQVAESVLPPSHWAFDPELPRSRPDPTRARSLLAEAGYPNGLEIAFTGNADQRAQQQQEVLIEQLKRAGITARWLRAPLGSGPFFREKRGAALLTGWSGRPDPSMTFRSLYGTAAFWNAGGTDPTGGPLQAALLAAQATTDTGARKTAFAALHRMVRDQALSIPLGFNLQLIAHGKKVQGFRTNLLGKARFDGVHLAAA